MRGDTNIRCYLAHYDYTARATDTEADEARKEDEAEEEWLTI